MNALYVVNQRSAHQ